MAKKSTIKKMGEHMYPMTKGVISHLTMGVGGAFLEMFDEDYGNLQQKRLAATLHLFATQTAEKLNQLELKMSVDEFKRMLESPEFFQVFVRIAERVKIESREKIREAYSNLLVNLIKDDVRLDFDEKLYFVDLLEDLSEGHLKILLLFYFRGNSFKSCTLKSLIRELGCRTKSGDGQIVLVLDPMKVSMAESLLSDLEAKKLIKLETKIESQPNVEVATGRIKKINSIESTLQQKYVGTKLGLQFYKFISEYK